MSLAKLFSTQSAPTPVEAALRADVEALATSEGRMYGTAGHAKARAYLVERLRELELEPLPGGEGPGGFELPYEVGDTPMCNVMGVVPGRDRSLAPLLVGAHYDTCGPLPGADDNAAAIAVALELAARLRRAPAPRDVIIALFDGEEPPHFHEQSMGSIYWYCHQRRTPVHMALILDLVGHDVPIPGRKQLLFIMGMESDPGLVPADLDELDTPGLRLQPALNRYVGDLSDHMIFRANKRPFLFLSCGRWRHYHCATDTPDRLNYTKMAAITDLCGKLVVRSALAELSGPFGQGDSLPVELAGVRRNFGLPLRSRADIDSFVGMAMSNFAI